MEQIRLVMFHVPTSVDSIMFDTRPPEVELISPIHNEFRNFTSIDFTINEPLQSWKIKVKAIAEIRIIMLLIHFKVIHHYTQMFQCLKN
jgi:hypothetical protein